MQSAHLLGRKTGADMPVVASGKGVWLTDTSGKTYLDASGGAAVSPLGHSHPGAIAAAKAQLDKIAFAHTGFFTSEPAEELGERLAALAPKSLSKVYPVSGGSEAVEAAIKLARQYFLEIGQSSRRHVIARWQSYHGNTLGALAAGGNRWRRGQFEPMLSGAMSHIAPCHYWRFGHRGESEGDYARRVADELETRILELGPDNVAAFIAEPVVGATMGAVPAPPEYFGRIRRICDKYGVLLILDEVMCGSGRTGSFFAFEQEDVVPDIVTLAKGIGAGVQPLGVMMLSDSIYHAIASGSGFFQHGHTYMGHPVACATGVAVLDAIEKENLIENVRDKGKKLRSALDAQFGQHPHIGDIRGRGLFLGLELVEDKDTKAAFDPARQINGKIKKAAMDQGLICYPGGGTIDGRLGDHVLLAPPYILEDEHIPLIVERLAVAIETALDAR